MTEKEGSRSVVWEGKMSQEITVWTGGKAFGVRVDGMVRKPGW